MPSLSRSWIVASAFFAATSFAATSFAADRQAPVPPHVPTADPLLATGIVDLSIGGTLILAGAFTEDEPPFGVFAGAGLGTIAAGIPMLVVGAKKVTYARHSETTFAAGSALASFGATATGAALGYVIGDALQRRRLDREVEPDANNGWYLGPAISGGLGAAIGIVGASLMVVGGAEMTPEKRREAAEKRDLETRARRNAGVKAPRSVSRRTAGQVLVGFGAATLTGALATGIAFGDAEGSGVIMHFVTTIPLAGSSLVFHAVGIPLWVTGAQEIPASEAAQVQHDETWIPALEVGPGIVTMTTRF